MTLKLNRRNIFNIQVRILKLSVFDWHFVLATQQNESNLIVTSVKNG